MARRSSHAAITPCPRPSREPLPSHPPWQLYAFSRQAGLKKQSHALHYANYRSLEITPESQRPGNFGKARLVVRGRKNNWLNGSREMTSSGMFMHRVPAQFCFSSATATWQPAVAPCRDPHSACAKRSEHKQAVSLTQPACILDASSVFASTTCPGTNAFNGVRAGAFCIGFAQRRQW